MKILLNLPIKLCKGIVYYIYLIKYLIEIDIEYITCTEEYRKIVKAKLFVLLQHHKVNQKYDNLYPYYYHLKMVLEKAEYFYENTNISREEFNIICITALGHDLIEDTRMTYNDVLELFGKQIADCIFTCTELRGKNRAERHGPEYMKLLKEDRLGRFVKLSDICANMTMGKKTGSSMLKKYQKEYKTKIYDNLYTEEFKFIFAYIEANLLK
jgi:(p)ppGpp synthase/HD superfamily hydrolase